jgi:hypothetical protein
MKAFEINTTAWDEENFILFTDLTESQIIDVITPIVMRERKLGEEYTNDDLIDALIEAYPSNKVYAYQNNPKLISI